MVRWRGRAVCRVRRARHGRRSTAVPQAAACALGGVLPLAGLVVVVAVAGWLLQPGCGSRSMKGGTSRAHRTAPPPFGAGRRAGRRAGPCCRRSWLVGADVEGGGGGGVDAVELGGAAQGVGTHGGEKQPVADLNENEYGGQKGEGAEVVRLGRFETTGRKGPAGCQPTQCCSTSTESAGFTRRTARPKTNYADLQLGQLVISEQRVQAVAGGAKHGRGEGLGRGGGAVGQQGPTGREARWELGGG